MQDAVRRALVWFRRDLRADDHAALHYALRAAEDVYCVFVFDTAILDPLPRADRRVEFIRDSLVELDAELARRGGGLVVLHGDPVVEIPALARALGVQAVYANHDDEPYAQRRDVKVRAALAAAGTDLRTRKDHVVFERDEVLTSTGTPFGVFTPYKRAWLARLTPVDVASLDTRKRSGRLAPAPADRRGVPELAALGFRATNLREFVTPGASGAERLLEEFLRRIDSYAQTRDFPGVHGPSYLSVHLRFGTLSVRAAMRAADARAREGSAGADTWRSELIWREFYQQILFHHPHVVGHAYKRDYDAIEWETGPRADELFDAWCAGKTGYPLVDAAMRQINVTGYMHNRLRMVAASFLTKDLGLDWRRGEEYFAIHLNDFDLASNNGGWQWAASTGCDAQPYFRIFNPESQSRKFDAGGTFIRRYVPELAALPDDALHAPWRAPAPTLAAAGVELGRTYPKPIVDHATARQRTLERYGVVRGRN